MDTTTTIGHGPVHIAAETPDELCTTIATIAVLGPGDVLVIRMNTRMTVEQASGLVDAVRHRLGIERVLVLDAGATMAIAHRDPEQ